MKQSEALDILKLGHNVFLTGPAGSGKTFVLRDFIEYLKKHKIGVGVTASTGIAATHMGGMTIHSWCGMGIKDELTASDIDKIVGTSKIKARMDETKVLIIDEVSMLDAPRLDMVDQICRAFKDTEKAFGGLQVVLAGDLFQLPPITKRGEQTQFVFEADAWRNMSVKICYLEEQHRQDDGDLLLLLNAIRNNETNEEHGRILEERYGSAPSDKTVTKLFTHNADVDRINEAEIEKLDTAEKTYLMTVAGNKQLASAMMQSCLAPEYLRLKLGSEVMFVANDQTGKYVNGTRGTIVGFNEDDGIPLVHTVDDKTIPAEKFTWKLEGPDGETVASISQVPLRLAWAITVHKSQGMTLDAAEVDLARTFEPGMGYVALSRVKSLDGLYLKGINQMAMMINPVVLEFDEKLRSNSVRNQQAIQKMDTDQINKHHAHIQSQLATKPKQSDDEAIEYDEGLYEQLSKWRTKTAKQLSKPSFMVLGNQTLKLIASQVPATKQKLLSIKGIGSKKVDDYGSDILTIVKEYTSKN